MEPREFLKLASTLVTQSQPAQIRTAISRAYYAVFNTAAQFLADLGFPLPRAGVHVAVQHRLQNCADLKIKRIGSELTDLHTKRIQADYRLSQKSIEGQRTALTVISQADRMMQALENCIADEPRRRVVVKAINEWLVLTGQSGFTSDQSK